MAKVNRGFSVMSQQERREYAHDAAVAGLTGIWEDTDFDFVDFSSVTVLAHLEVDLTNILPTRLLPPIL